MRRGEQTVSVRVVAPAEVLATAIDPVCGMAVAAADQTPHVDHEGRRVYFCCEGCRTAFEHDPPRYLSRALTLFVGAGHALVAVSRVRSSGQRVEEAVHMGTTASAGWPIGLALGIVVILVAAAIVIVIVALAMRIAKQAKTAEGAVEVLRQQTAELDGIGRINDSGVRILHSARALRKVAVGK